MEGGRYRFAAFREIPGPESWLLWEPADRNMWRKVRDIGVRYGFIETVVGFHHLEQTSIDRSEPD